MPVLPSLLYGGRGAPGHISREEATKHAFMVIFKPADFYNTEYIECVCLCVFMLSTFTH